MERSASGRGGVEADEVRAGEVRPLHSSIEAGEQTWATGSGAGGAKGEDRGEHGRATHVPNTVPGKRVPEARLCTRSCSWDSPLTTQGGSPGRESRSPGSVRGVLSNGHSYRDKVSDRKGIANQTGPESCVAHREGPDEALTGEPAGQPLSREIFILVQGADAVSVVESNTGRRVSASDCSALRGLRPWHVC